MKKKCQIGITLLLMLLIGCNKENENKSVNNCDTTNTTFNQIYTNLVNNNPFGEIVTMDSYLHSYTFEVTSPASICKIGYRSQPTFEAFPYIIEIFNNTTNAQVYVGNHTFSSSITEYVAIPPVVLSVGDSYTIKRFQNNSGNAISIGRLIGVSSFPHELNNLKITGVYFGEGGGEINLLPYIDIVFE